MLKNFKFSNQKGFTLIELMIVVAIIGILAAIAIPQFAAYRIRGFNSSAESDVRNLSTAEAAFFSDWQIFGMSQNVAPNAAAIGAVGAETVLTGPATTTSIIGNQTGAAATSRGLNIGIGNLVSISAGVDATSASFITMGKHLNGDTAFGMDSDSSAVYSNAANPPVWAPGVVFPGLTFNSSPAVDDFAAVAAWQAK